jgi:predicted porin
MKKTLIAAALAAAVAAPSANAGVVIYGKLHTSIDYFDQNATLTGLKQWRVTSRASRIGFKGSEDLGNGLKAIWKVEFGVDIADNAGWNSNRNRYVGLAGDWGTFLVGRHDTPYKMAFYSTGIDMLGDSIIDQNAMFGYNEVRASNAIAFISPNMNGLTLAAAIMPCEGGVGCNGLADFYSLGVMYKNNGLRVAFGYEDFGAGLIKNEKWLLGAGYTMNAFDVAVAYQNWDVGLPQDWKSYSLAFGYSFGNNKVIVTGGKMDMGFADATSWGLALQHKLSKRTSAYAAYGSSERQLGGMPGPIFPVNDAKAFSLGMIHNF